MANFWKKVLPSMKFKSSTILLGVVLTVWNDGEVTVDATQECTAGGIRSGEGL
jgi:hypothetical protein